MTPSQGPGYTILCARVRTHHTIEATMLHLLFWLAVGHALADYLLQPLAVSRDKSPVHNPTGWAYAMAAHCLANAGAVALATGSVDLGISELGLHFAIDLAKCQGWLNRHQDQAAHVLCKLLWAVAWWAKQRWGV